MQRWEYLHVRVNVDAAGHEKVVSMNGQNLDDVMSSVLEMKVKSKGEDIHDFLRRLGQEGWELVSYTYAGIDTGYVAILKRPSADERTP